MDNENNPEVIILPSEKISSVKKTVGICVENKTNDNKLHLTSTPGKSKSF